MANVAPYVAQIRAAIYGEQVRESIARAIEEMNQDNIDTQGHYDSTISDVQDAIADAVTAAAAAEAIRDEVQTKLDNGDFIGDTGPAGTAASVTVGTVQTGLPGTAAQVTNSGSSSAAVLNFVIPQGASGTVENIDSVFITFDMDTVYQNIASGMTLRQLFSRIQLLFNFIILTDTNVAALKTKRGMA